MPQHQFSLSLHTNPGSGHDELRPGQIARRHTIVADGKPALEGSSASIFHGEASRWNPEELLIAALAQCHYLSVVYVAATRGIEMSDYRCSARGSLEWDSSGRGQMTEVVLEPEVTVSPEHVTLMEDVHREAHDLCFIARSVSCEVTINPRTIEAS